MIAEREHGDAPFATVLDAGVAYFRPDTVDEETLATLQRETVRNPEHWWIRRLRYELRRALEWHLDGMDVAEFDREVEPAAKTIEIFLRRMWAVAFPDEPIPGAPNGPWDTTYTLLDIYFDEPRPEHNWVHPDHLHGQLHRPDEQQTPFVRSIRPELVRMLQGDFDGLDLQQFRGRASSYYRHLRRDDRDFARHAWRHLFPDEPVPES